MENDTSQLALQAFESLFQKHHGRVLAYALSLTKEGHTAEDLVQEAFVVAWHRLEDFDHQRDFGNWVRGIVHYKYKDWLKKRKERPLEDEVLEHLEHLHDHWDASQRQHGHDPMSFLMACVEKLKPSVKQVVQSFYFDRLSILDTAKAMNLTDSTVKKRLQRSRTLLYDCMTLNMRSVSHEK